MLPAAVAVLRSGVLLHQALYTWYTEGLHSRSEVGAGSTQTASLIKWQQ